MKKVYSFGDGKAEGNAHDKNILGGKGANLAEMVNIGIPVPPGFTISTDICNYFLKNKSYPNSLQLNVDSAINKVEKIMHQKFNDFKNPLLVSVRSGARQSMPGMMDTVLNIGLTTETIPGFIDKTGNERFVYDVYRRLITMYADVVMEKANDIEPIDGIGIREKLELLIAGIKRKNQLKSDSELSTNQLKDLCEKFKLEIKQSLGENFPDDGSIQLWGAISAVFKSWNGKRAVTYRKIEGIPNHWGTAVNVQAMVFGNMGKNSATGVAFTRNPATGENSFFGEWLPNAQGEDVVAGIRTPNPLNNQTGNVINEETLENYMPIIYKQLYKIQNQLELHYNDMQDIEFTIQNNKLWMLQTRTGKRNGSAAIRMAIDMMEEGLIDEKTALLRINADQLNEVMHPMIDLKLEKEANLIAKGLPAGPGGASGQIVFSSDEAEKLHKIGKKVILVRNETSPEDIHGMYASAAILTARGGMTSHAALVARGWGKCCIVGCSEIQISIENNEFRINNMVFKKGDWITLNGSSGNVYEGKIPLKSIKLESNKYFQKLMKLADQYSKLGVRTNADSASDARQAKSFGAKGIGLCRTEHMFFNPERISAMRKMIIAKDENARRIAIMQLLPFQRKDFYEILKTMAPYPVTIRLLDPPLHEFLPQENKQIKKLASDLSVSFDSLKEKINKLHELNPMLGHRGCRLGISFSEITEMQARAIFEATAKLVKENISPFPEIMVPLIATSSEFNHQKKIIDNIANLVQKEFNIKFKYLVGTMIELPRACTIADKIAETAQFFSFGTNDLTQTTFGFSRDDIGGFLLDYLDKKILIHDPFQSIDQEGVGSLVSMGTEKGRKINKNLKIGICGEHGGDPDSISFFDKIGLDYVSCSPYRVPIARLASAQAAIKNKNND